MPSQIQLPDPLVPADCDLRRFPYMPIDINRLFDSRFHAICNDAEWRAGVTLWLKSFHQVPAASLPENDVELCRLAELGRDMKTWLKVKDKALHGWVLCADHRWYHPLIAEKANEAYDTKQMRKKAAEARWTGKGQARESVESGGGQGVGNQQPDRAPNVPEGVKSLRQSPERIYNRSKPENWTDSKTSDEKPDQPSKTESCITDAQMVSTNNIRLKQSGIDGESVEKQDDSESHDGESAMQVHQQVHSTSTAGADPCAVQEQCTTTSTCNPEAEQMQCKREGYRKGYNTTAGIPTHTGHSQSERPVGVRENPSCFEQFWTAYPKKIAKAGALKRWKVQQLDALIAPILADLSDRIQRDPAWQRGFIPNPTTYLNQERWNDEIPASPSPVEHTHGTDQQHTAPRNLSAVERVRLASTAWAEREERRLREAGNVIDITPQNAAGLGKNV
ncbi:hypothetical protein AB4090_08315 [Acidithiobacillus sp. IBUN Pt1247-S3]|uniref:hypothetical protein n=1 Tax=Acidithiobacillus sp. IBUN Pt1247-S3 TaxID=3166642 RepID=UPI0034E47DC7